MPFLQISMHGWQTNARIVDRVDRKETPMPTRDIAINKLRKLGHLSSDEAQAVIQQEGLDGLRVRVAARLYAKEFLTSGEAAQRVGLRNRGLLLRYLDTQHIAPIPNPTEETEAVFSQLTQRMNNRFNR